MSQCEDYSTYKVYSHHFMKHSQYLIVNKYNILLEKTGGIFRKRTYSIHATYCTVQHTAHISSHPTWFLERMFICF